MPNRQQQYEHKYSIYRHAEDADIFKIMNFWNWNYCFWKPTTEIKHLSSFATFFCVSNIIASYTTKKCQREKPRILSITFPLWMVCHYWHLTDVPRLASLFVKRNRLIWNWIRIFNSDQTEIIKNKYMCVVKSNVIDILLPEYQSYIWNHAFTKCRIFPILKCRLAFFPKDPSKVRNIYLNLLEQFDEFSVHILSYINSVAKVN